QAHDRLDPGLPRKGGRHRRCAASRAACSDSLYPSLVTVAPDTESMSALCASRVALVSSGSAYALISRSRPLPSGYAGTDTSTIRPPTTVIVTCTGPQRVRATEPANTEPPGTEPLDFEPPGFAPPAASGPAGGPDDAAAPVPIVLVRYVNSRTTAATVDSSHSVIRRMPLPLPGESFGVEVIGQYAGGVERDPHRVRPALRTADVHGGPGGVRGDPAQRLDVADPGQRARQPGAP